jgi:ankyrin repeat protein
MLRRLTLLLAFTVLFCLAPPASAGEIHRAIEAGDAALVKQILEKDPGALVQLDESQFREPPLLVAAATGSVEIARILLDAGADIDAGDSDNSTALGVAAMRGHGEMVAFLIERGANVNHRDRKADCPLSFAVYGRDEAIIQQILDAGADLYFRNFRGHTLLHIACQRNVPGFVKHLLENRADVNALDADGASPLGAAAFGGNPEIVQLLLDRGADPNAGIPGGATPLIFASWRNQLETARVLLENGADPNLVSHGGGTPLIWAAESCSAEMVRLLIEHGAEVNHANEAGATALVMAAAGGYSGRIEALLDADADPNLGADTSGRSALHLACVGGHTEAARKLLEGGAEMNAPTPSGDTPLYLAHYYGHPEVASLLSDSGAKGAPAGKIDRSLAAMGDVKEGEAVLWFMGHSGWAVKTKNHLLIFDYFPQGESPANASLCCGKVNPAEIANEKVAVFASHHHGDHFSPAVFEWRGQVSDITYFLGLQPEDAPPYTFMPERMEETFGDIKLTTIHSTDAGVGMVVEVDGVTIFHPGDHANGRIGLMDEFTDEIDFLADRGIRPDIFFGGIRGCSLGTPEQVKEGICYMFEKLKPRTFLPMHAGADGNLYREFIAEVQPQFTSVQMAAPGNRGDHFVYSNWKLDDPRGNGRHAATE